MLCATPASQTSHKATNNPALRPDVKQLAEVAKACHQAPEQVAIGAIEAQLPARRRLSFSVARSSGSSGGGLALSRWERPLWSCAVSP